MAAGVLGRADNNVMGTGAARHGCRYCPMRGGAGRDAQAQSSRQSPVRRYTSELCPARMRPMPAPTFQQIIQTLGQYWGERGCVLLQPLDTEVGAGTFHPATFLRALGPEPWAAAYVQPSRRPTDGRYGDNPNRLQHYYQFQVEIGRASCRERGERTG